MKCKDVEKDLILYYYGEIDAPTKKEIQGHIEICRKCMSSWERLRSTLDAIEVEDPELPDSFWRDYGRKVYKKIEAKKTYGSFWLIKP